jgi:hypothetical protein
MITQSKSLPVPYLLLIFFGGMILLAPLLLTGAAWSGHKTLPVEVRVVDKESGEPIAGACVRVGDGDVEMRWLKARWRPNRPIHRTDRSTTGEASFDVRFPAGGRDHLWNHSGSVTFSATCIEASAPGYTAQALPLQALAESRAQSR